MARPAKRPPGGTQPSPRAAEAHSSARAPSAADLQFVSLAHIVRARGRIGEVAATILTDFPDRLTRLREVLLCDAAGRRRPARVRRCWLSPSRGGQAIFHFEGVDSINDAQKLVGCEVQVPLADRVPLPGGLYYVSDLIGCEVEEVEEVLEVMEVQENNSAVSEQQPESSITSKTSTTSRTSLGFVRDVYFESGTPLLVVATATGGELLIPFAGEICTRIDIAARRIEVRLPPGLRDLNPP